jgi:hypothetical protein
MLVNASSKCPAASGFGARHPMESSTVVDVLDCPSWSAILRGFCPEFDGETRDELITLRCAVQLAGR